MENFNEIERNSRGTSSMWLNSYWLPNHSRAFQGAKGNGRARGVTAPSPAWGTRPW